MKNELPNEGHGSSPIIYADSVCT